MTDYRQIGGKLGAYIRSNNPSIKQLRAFLTDVIEGDSILKPLQDAVDSQGFQVLRSLAGSGEGAVQRDAFLQDLASRYLPDVVDGVGQAINGMLDLPSGTTIYASADDSGPSAAASPPWQSSQDSQTASSVQIALHEGSAQETYYQQKRFEYTDNFEFIKASDLASDLKIPVGYLISWCKRKNYPSKAGIHPESMLTFEQAARIKRDFTGILWQRIVDFAGLILILFFLCLIVYGFLHLLFKI